MHDLNILGSRERICLMDGLIAAISTAWGESGIAIIRVSGEGSRDLVDGFFRGGAALAQTPPRFMKHGFMVDQDGQDIDEVLTVWFKGPNSYTGEESAEIHCHGGTVAARKCLERCLALGARMALPGEYTRRAFLNGRLDLAQAESVIGIIRARSDESLKAAVKCLRGSLSKRIEEIHEEMLEISALGEANLDHPEEDVPPLDACAFSKRVALIGEKLGLLLSSVRSGRFLREGIRVAITGRPNVGKSSLMNAFLEESRSIVTSMPGTTRDIIEEVMTHKGIPLRLVDTAGLRSPRDDAEKEGVSRARAAIKEADIRIWVIDGSEDITGEDIEISEELRKTCHVVAINKSDLPPVVTESTIRKILPMANVIIISAATGAGIEELKDLVLLSVAGMTSLDEDLNTTERQVEEMKRAMELIIQSLDALDAGTGLDAALDSFSEARTCIGRILGVSSSESLLDRIFSSFCIGK